MPPGLIQLHCLSVLIPARNEAGCVVGMVRSVNTALRNAEICHEIVVVDDGSSDGTLQSLQSVSAEISELKLLRHEGPHGFGRAIYLAWQNCTGDAVAIMMADESDSPRDLVEYWHLLQSGADCVFGSRFIPGGGAEDYPGIKRILNRVVNTGIRWLFRLPYNDVTNAFKAYRREVLQACEPWESDHFELTVELPLKAISNGFDYCTPGIHWKNRRTGLAKLHLREMGSRYLRCIYQRWLEWKAGPRPKGRCLPLGANAANSSTPS